MFTTYMTPSYSSSQCKYGSLGGAGFVYPATLPGGSKYGRGDVVSCELELQQDGTGAQQGWARFPCFTSFSRIL